MAAQRIPGPYQAVNNGPDRHVITGSVGGRVCIMPDSRKPHSPGVETVAATAAFIVRACNSHDELLAALRMFIAWEDGTHDTSPAQQHINAMKAARAAIAKAEGRS